MTLEPGEIAQLRSLNDRLDIAEVEDIYLPVAPCRCTWRRPSGCSSRSSASSAPRTPRCTSSASAARWRWASRPPRVLQALLARWPNVPKVDLITTDGFRFPNAVLEREGLMEKKGFPES